MSPRGSHSPRRTSNAGSPPHPPTYATHGSSSPEDSTEQVSLSPGHSYFLGNQDISSSSPESTQGHLEATPFNYPINPESTLIASSQPPSSSQSMSASTIPVPYALYGNMFPSSYIPPRTSAPETDSFQQFSTFDMSNTQQQHHEPFYGIYNISPTPQVQSEYRPILAAPPAPLNPSRHWPNDTERSSQRSRRRSPPTRQVYPARRRRGGIRDDERLLLELRDERRLAWREITEIFNRETDQNKNESALQMQFKRLKEKMRIWTHGDDLCLYKAVQRENRRHQCDSKEWKWENVSRSMLDYGVQEKWTNKACQDQYGQFSEDYQRLLQEEILEENDYSSSYRSTPSSSPESWTYSSF